MKVNGSTIGIQTDKSAESTNPQSGLNLPDLARIGVGIVGMFYALGFLVVTFHLSRFGVAPVTWLRPQYLLAGIWCLLPLLLFAGGLAFASLQIAEPWIRYSMVVPRKTRIYRHIVGSIQGIGSLFGAFLFISSAISVVVGPSFFYGRYRWGHSSMITLKLAALSIATIVCALASFSTFRALGGVPSVRSTVISAESTHGQRLVSMRLDRWAALISLGALLTFATLVFILLYVHSFSVLVYSSIPSALGGGKPQSVVFLIDSRIQNTAPVVVDTSGTRSVPYNLLLTTDSSYIVESPAKGEMAIEFKQDAVQGMIVLPQETH
jgi:hypothetical protein